MKAAHAKKIVVLADYDPSQGLTQKEAISMANKRRLRLLSNREFDRMLVLVDTGKSNKIVHPPAWTGTMTAYVESGKSFKEANRKDDGKYVVWADPETGITYRFPVREDFRNAKNSILAINHGFDENGKPTFEIHEDGKDNISIHVPDEGKVHLIQGFPAEDRKFIRGCLNKDGKPLMKVSGLRLTDKNFLIPVGSKVDPHNPDARGLWRTDKRVGLLARSDRSNMLWLYYWHQVIAINSPSKRFGALAMETSAK